VKRDELRRVYINNKMISNQPDFISNLYFTEVGKIGQPVTKRAYGDNKIL
jgi:hypothetical protein